MDKNQAFDLYLREECGCSAKYRLDPHSAGQYIPLGSGNQCSYHRYKDVSQNLLMNYMVQESLKQSGLLSPGSHEFSIKVKKST